MRRIHTTVILLCLAYTMPALANPIHKKRIDLRQRTHLVVQVGTASWYGRWHAGRLTASGERFNPRAMTCAHRTLPLGSIVKVTDLATGKDVQLEVNDRGPYVKGRIMDLSEGAARELGGEEKGLLTVRVEVITTPQVAAG